MRIALAQMPARSADPEVNMVRAEALLVQAADRGADLAALPEYFVLPADKAAEPVPGPLTERFGVLARRLHYEILLYRCAGYAGVEKAMKKSRVDRVGFDVNQDHCRSSLPSEAADAVEEEGMI